MSRPAHFTLGLVAGVVLVAIAYAVTPLVAAVVL